MHVLFANRQPDTIKSIRDLIVKHINVAIMRQASDFSDLVRQIEKGCFDLILLDWELPGMSPQRQLDFIERICPQAHVIVITGRQEKAVEAERAGVDAFINGQDPLEGRLRRRDRLRARAAGVEGSLGDPRDLRRDPAGAG